MQQRADLQEVAAAVGHREEEHARQVQLRHRVLVAVHDRRQHLRRILHQRRVVHQHQLCDVRKVLRLAEHALRTRNRRLQHALRRVARVAVDDRVDRVQHHQRARHRLQVRYTVHEQLPAQLADRLQRCEAALLAAHLRIGSDQLALQQRRQTCHRHGTLLQFLVAAQVPPLGDALVLLGRGGSGGLRSGSRRRSSRRRSSRRRNLKVRVRSVHSRNAHSRDAHARSTKRNVVIEVGIRSVHAGDSHAGDSHAGSAERHVLVEVGVGSLLLHGLGSLGSRLRLLGLLGLRSLLALAATALGGSGGQEQTRLDDGVLEDGADAQLGGGGGVRHGEQVHDDLGAAVEVAQNDVHVGAALQQRVEEDDEVVAVGAVRRGVDQRQDLARLIESTNLVAVEVVQRRHRLHAEDLVRVIRLTQHTRVDGLEEVARLVDVELDRHVPVHHLAQVEAVDHDLVRKRLVVDKELLVVPQRLLLALRNLLLRALQTVDLLLQRRLQLVARLVVPDDRVGGVVVQHLEEHQLEVALVVALPL